MEKINVKWSPNVNSGETEVELCDMDIESKEEWDALSECEQQTKLIEALSGRPEQPYMFPVDW